jgi:hypothetical protein
VRSATRSRPTPMPRRQAEKSRHHEQTRTGLGDETRDTKPDVVDLVQRGAAVRVNATR